MAFGASNPDQIMETQTKFDLSDSLAQWRTACAQSATIRPETLAELEAHLQDSMAALCRQGLSAEEAFLVGTKRLGAPAQLANEFGKVNPAKIWLDRLVWVLVGILLIQLISQTMFMLSSLITILFRTVVDKPLVLLSNLGISPSTFSFGFGLFASGLGLLAWMLVFRSVLSRYSSIELPSTKPARLFILIGVGSCLFTVLGYAVNHWLVVTMVNFDSGTQIRFPADYGVRIAQSALQSLAIPLGLFVGWRSLERKRGSSTAPVQH